MRQSVSWTEPRLCHYHHDMGKAWFVYFEFIDERGVTHRKQYRNGINLHHNKTQRIREGHASVIYFGEKLKAGWNPVTKSYAQQSDVTDVPVTIRHAFERVLALKKSSLKKKSYNKYDEVSKIFLAWAAKHNQDTKPLSEFDSRMAQAHLDYLVSVRKYSGTTHNNCLSILKAIASVMEVKGRKWINENPFKGIAALPKEVGKNIAFTAPEVRALLHYLRFRNIRLYYAANYMLHAFIRKTETCELRVRQIDWNNRTIRVESSSAKNRTQQSVAVPEDLWTILIEMDIEDKPGEWFIFGQFLQTGPDQLSRPDDLSDKFREYRQHLKGIIKAVDSGEQAHKNYDRKTQQYFFEFEDNARLIASISSDKTYYSFKHTGVVLYWPIINDVYHMMRQLRHSDMATTMIYLKSLGLMPNEAFLNARLKLE